MFLANPDMDQELYRRQFHLNDTEISRITSLIPKEQFLLKTPQLAKVANLNVDRRSYWLYINDPYDNRRRKEAFEAHRFEKRVERACRSCFVIPALGSLAERLGAYLAVVVAPIVTVSVLVVESALRSIAERKR
jgi:hypothetical protein